MSVMRFSRIAWGLLIIGLAGCGSSTGVLSAGPDTYTTAASFAPARGGATEAEKVTLTDANAYCQQKNRVFVPITMEPGFNSYSITFKCLTPDDPSIAKYKVEGGPDVIMEQRTRQAP
jgi:hypothetical protein